MARNKKRPALLPARHNEPDLFVCDVLDATPKGDRASMEHPLFSLSVKKDLTPFHYERGGVKMTITPAATEGRANIFDRDVLIYVLSQLMAAKNDGQPLSRRMSFCAHDLLKATNRHTNGQAYATLRRALTRLQFTQIETNIHDNGIGEWRSISFITDAKIVKEDATGRMLDVEIEIGAWLQKAVENNSVLTLSPEYFYLRKPLERRLYELARKHCGQQPLWKIGLTGLQHKTGSSSTSKEFKRLVKAICTTDTQDAHMPDYDFRLNGEMLEVTPKPSFSSLNKPTGQLSFIGQLAPETYDEARLVAPNWDVRYLENEWRQWTKTPPKNADRAFIGFCKKWYEKRGSPQ